MEILIGLLLIGLVGLVVFTLKATTEETKNKQAAEDEKSVKISNLQAELEKKETEVKNVTELRRKLEEEYFKVKDEADILKKDNVEIALKLKHFEKSKDDLNIQKSELKEKDALLQQETIARQKLQGELSLRDIDIEKLKADLKAKTEMYEGIKGQFNELENELQKVRQESLKKGDIVKEKTHEPDNPIIKEVNVAEPEKIEPVTNTNEMPGFHDMKGAKVEIKKGVTSDTDFLTPQTKNTENAGIVPDGTFKLTNVNKPASQSEQEQNKSKEKLKSNKETLIDGFHA